MARHEDPFADAVSDKNLGMEKLDYLERDGFFTILSRPVGVDYLRQHIYFIDGKLAIDEKAMDNALDVQNYYLKIYKNVYLRKTSAIAQRMVQKMTHHLIIAEELRREELPLLTDSELIGRCGTSRRSFRPRHVRAAPPARPFPRSDRPAAQKFAQRRSFRKTRHDVRREKIRDAAARAKSRNSIRKIRTSSPSPKMPSRRSRDFRNQASSSRRSTGRNAFPGRIFSSTKGRVKSSRHSNSAIPRISKTSKRWPNPMSLSASARPKNTGKP